MRAELLVVDEECNTIIHSFATRANEDHHKKDNSSPSMPKHYLAWDKSKIFEHHQRTTNTLDTRGNKRGKEEEDSQSKKIKTH